MRDFLIGNGPLVAGAVLLVEAVVLLGLLRRFTKTPAPMILCMELVTVGLLL